MGPRGPVWRGLAAACPAQRKETEVSKHNKTTHFVLTKFRTDDVLCYIETYFDEARARDE